jgi:predicted tellurium resistance membrane protein TerC
LRKLYKNKYGKGVIWSDDEILIAQDIAFLNIDVKQLIDQKKLIDKQLKEIKEDIKKKKNELKNGGRTDVAIQHCVNQLVLIELNKE